MNPRNWISRWPRQLIAVPAAAMMLLTGAASAQVASTPPSVTGWIRHNATVLGTVEPAAPLYDLAPFGQWTGNAKIVGLGESTHGAAEEETLKLRALRFLVERMGFRSIAWEEDWTTGLQINQYIGNGQGNLDALLRQMSPQWQSRQVADVLRWLRNYNAGHAGKVRFTGVEYYFTRALAYDAIDAYVARTAPERLQNLRRHLRFVRPSTPPTFSSTSRGTSACRISGRTYATPVRCTRCSTACPTGPGTVPARWRCTPPGRSCRSMSTTACRSRPPVTAWCTGTPTRPGT